MFWRRGGSNIGGKEPTANAAIVSPLYFAPEPPPEVELDL